MKNKWFALCGISFGIGFSLAIPTHKNIYKSLLTGLGASVSTISTVAILDKFSSADEKLIKNGAYLEERKKEIKEIEQCLEILLKKRKLTNNSLDILKEKIEKCKNFYSKISKKNVRLESSYKDNLSRIKQIETILKENKKYLYKNKQETDDLITLKSSIEKNIIELRKKADTQNIELSDQKKCLKEYSIEIEVLKTQRLSLFEDVANTKSKLESLREKEEVLTSRIICVDKHNNEINSNNQRLRDQKQELLIELQGISIEFDKLNQILSYYGLPKRLREADIKEYLSQINFEINIRTKKLSEIEIEIEKILEQKLNVEVSLNDIKDKLSTYELENKDKKIKLKAINSQISLSNNELVVIKAKKEKILDSISELKSQENEILDEVKFLKEESKKLDLQILRRNEKIKSLDSKILPLTNSEKEKLLDSISELKSQENEILDEVKFLKEESKKLDLQILRRNEKIKSLDSKILLSARKSQNNFDQKNECFSKESLNYDCSSLDQKQEEIKNICKRRGIQICTHFTRVRNLSSILLNGLVPRHDLDNNDISYFYNDQDRFDNEKIASCLSISFPNSKTFYKFRKSSGEDWVVLSFRKEILWELECAFCSTNAASKEVTKIPIAERKMFQAFENMFLNSEYRSYPADVQAEILVFGTIHPKYIKSISFETVSSRNSWISNNPTFVVNKGLFYDRELHLNHCH